MQWEEPSKDETVRKSYTEVVNWVRIMGQWSAPEWVCMAQAQAQDMLSGVLRTRKASERESVTGDGEMG